MAQGAPAWLQPPVFGQVSLEALDFTMGELCVSASRMEKGSMCMAQELPGVSVCETELIGTLCAVGTSRPVPLLVHGQVRTPNFPG